MSNTMSAARLGAALMLGAAIAACSGAGGLGNVLGSVLGGGGGAQEVDGTIRAVNTQSSSLTLQQSNGQNVALQFDDQTSVGYQNQSYPVTALERGDQVAAFVEQTQDGGYYVDSVTVVQPVSGSSARSGALLALQGQVRSIDRNNRVFTLYLSDGTQALVSLPYDAGTRMLSRFNTLKNGDTVVLHGVLIATGRVELRHWN
jgi:hypothetical protein